MKGFANLSIIWGGLLSLGNLGFYFFTGHQAARLTAAIDSGDVSTRRARAFRTFVELVDDLCTPMMVFTVCGLCFVAGGVLLASRNRSSRYVLYGASLLTVLVFVLYIIPQYMQLAYILHFRKNGESVDGSGNSLLLITLAGVLLLAFPAGCIAWLTVKRKKLDAWLAK